MATVGVKGLTSPHWPITISSTVHVYIVCKGLDTRRRSLYAVGATESDMQRSSVDDMIYVTVDNDSYSMQDHDHDYAASEALY